MLCYVPKMFYKILVKVKNKIIPFFVFCLWFMFNLNLTIKFPPKCLQG